MRELLERLYGTCLVNHQFRWENQPRRIPWETQIEPTLRKVAAALTAHQGFGVGDFVKADLIAACDFWVLDPGFIVEFDESQHFTAPRKLALSAYPAEHPFGLSRRSAGLHSVSITTQGTTTHRTETNNERGTTRCGTSSRHLKADKPTVRLYARDRGMVARWTRTTAII